MSTRRASRGTIRVRSSRFGRSRRPGLESLEDRTLLATVTVNASDVIRPVETQLLGVNLTWWDSSLNTSQTTSLVQSAGLNFFRFPGGSSSDDFHFNSPASYNGQGTDQSMASFVSSVNGQAVITLDYGSGSPQEAAAMLAYFNGSTTNTTPIGNGPEWNDSTGQWQTVNWQTAGYWASLRASAPLAVDDGLNFLRLDHAAPMNFDYFEVGNEEYGSWEIDHHTIEHDPTTYVTFAKQFATYASSIAPNISIGIDAGSPYEDNNWVANVLQQSAVQGFRPGFISDHNYVQGPGSESDSNLLFDTTSDPNSSDPDNPYDFAVRAQDYYQLVDQYLGQVVGQGVQLLATEFNSVYSNPGKQTTSLVNGLFLADTLGGLMDSSYDGADVWDLRNDWETGNNNSSSLYGWRQGGDYGLLGSSDGSAPSSGTYTEYPTYFAEELASKIIKAGGSVVQTTSSDPNLTTYAVTEANGDLELLVLNKNSSAAESGQFQVSNFNPSSTATVWQYGEAQDTAQSLSTTGASALANFTASLSLSGGSFSMSFPAYSMTVLDIPKATTPPGGPTITKAASGTPNPVIGKTTVLSVGATDPAGASSLVYTWITVGSPPASVTYSVNGTNAASSSTATFSRAGTYSFLVTATDPSHNSITSAVTVVVDQTVTSLAITPTSASVVAGTTYLFTSQTFDQFGNALATAPNFTWSVASGGGTIGASSGLYAAPSAPGTAKVQVAVGTITSTANVTITAASSHPYATVNFIETSDWAQGFGANIVLTNTGTSTINGWTLQFNFAPTITSIWNANISNHVGKQYSIVNASYDAQIAVGQSITIGFNGSTGDLTTGPTSYVLNGIALAPPVIPPLKANLTFADTENWGSGFTGSLLLTNTGAGSIMGWTLSFTFAGSITSIWNANIVSHVGNVYVIKNATYNSLISPNQAVSIGFNANGGNATTGPTSYVLNGVSIT
jgi:hypothetical protein